MPKLLFPGETIGDFIKRLLRMKQLLLMKAIFQNVGVGHILAAWGAASLLAAAAPARFIITYDGGGSLNAYQQNLDLFRDKGIEVVIDGPCFSACTIYVALDKVCITKRAVLYFHKGPSRTSTEFMQMHWTPKLRALLATRGELPDFKSGNYLPLTYNDLKSVLKAC